MLDQCGLLLRAALGLVACAMPSYDRALRFGQTVALILATFVFCGCALSHPAYPADWAPLEASGTSCGSIAGRYEDWGDDAYPASHFLFPRNSKAGAANTLALKESEAGVIEISTWRDTERATTQRRLVASANDYQCRDGVIELSTREFVGGGQAAGIETNAVRLMKSSDGALVIKHTSSGIGVCVIVPCGGSVDKWYRFKPSKVTLEE